MADAPMGAPQSRERALLAVGDVIELQLLELIFDSPTVDHVGVGLPSDLLAVETTDMFMGKIVAFMPAVPR